MPEKEPSQADQGDVWADALLGKVKKAHVGILASDRGDEAADALDGGLKYSAKHRMDSDAFTGSGNSLDLEFKGGPDPFYNVEGAHRLESMAKQRDDFNSSTVFETPDDLSLAPVKPFEPVSNLKALKAVNQAIGFGFTPEEIAGDKRYQKLERRSYAKELIEKYEDRNLSRDMLGQKFYDYTRMGSLSRAAGEIRDRVTREFDAENEPIPGVESPKITPEEREEELTARFDNYISTYIDQRDKQTRLEDLVSIVPDDGVSEGLFIFDPHDNQRVWIVRGRQGKNFLVSPIWETEGKVGTLPVEMFDPDSGWLLKQSFMGPMKLLHGANKEEDGQSAMSGYSLQMANMTIADARATFGVGTNVWAWLSDNQLDTLADYFGPYDLIRRDGGIMQEIETKGGSDRYGFGLTSQGALEDVPHARQIRKEFRARQKTKEEMRSFVKTMPEGEIFPGSSLFNPSEGIIRASAEEPAFAPKPGDTSFGDVAGLTIDVVDTAALFANPLGWAGMAGGIYIGGLAGTYAADVMNLDQQGQARDYLTFFAAMKGAKVGHKAGRAVGEGVVLAKDGVQRFMRLSQRLKDVQKKIQDSGKSRGLIQYDAMETKTHFELLMEQWDAKKRGAREYVNFMEGVRFDGRYTPEQTARASLRGARMPVSPEEILRNSPHEIPGTEYRKASGKAGEVRPDLRRGEVPEETGRAGFIVDEAGEAIDVRSAEDGQRQLPAPEPQRQIEAPRTSPKQLAYPSENARFVQMPNGAIIDFRPGTPLAERSRLRDQIRTTQSRMQGVAEALSKAIPNAEKMHADLRARVAQETLGIAEAEARAPGGDAYLTSGSDAYVRPPDLGYGPEFEYSFSGWGKPLLETMDDASHLALDHAESLKTMPHTEGTAAANYLSALGKQTAAEVSRAHAEARLIERARKAQMEAEAEKVSIAAELAEEVQAATEPADPVRARQLEQLRSHREGGGSTFDPDGTNRAGEDVWAVAVNLGDDYVSKAKRVTRKHLVAFEKKFAEQLAEPGRSIGTWWDKANGQHVFDVVELIKDRAEAEARGRERGQRAILNLKTFEEVSLKESPAAEAARVIREAEAAVKDRTPERNIPDEIAEERLLAREGPEEGPIEVTVDADGVLEVTVKKAERQGPEGSEGSHAGIALADAAVEARTPVVEISARMKAKAAKAGAKHDELVKEAIKRDAVTREAARGKAAEVTEHEPFVPDVPGMPENVVGGMKYNQHLYAMLREAEKAARKDGTPLTPKERGDWLYSIDLELKSRTDRWQMPTEAQADALSRSADQWDIAAGGAKKWWNQLRIEDKHRMMERIQLKEGVGPEFGRGANWYDPQPEPAKAAIDRAFHIYGRPNMRRMSKKMGNGPMEKPVNAVWQWWDGMSMSARGQMLERHGIELTKGTDVAGWGMLTDAGKDLAAAAFETARNRSPSGVVLGSLLGGIGHLVGPSLRQIERMSQGAGNFLSNKFWQRFLLPRILREADSLMEKVPLLGEKYKNVKSLMSLFSPQSLRINDLDVLFEVRRFAGEQDLAKSDAYVWGRGYSTAHRGLSRALKQGKLDAGMDKAFRKGLFRTRDPVALENGYKLSEDISYGRDTTASEARLSPTQVNAVKDMHILLKELQLRAYDLGVMSKAVAGEFPEGVLRRLYPEADPNISATAPQTILQKAISSWSYSKKNAVDHWNYRQDAPYVEWKGDAANASRHLGRIRPAHPVFEHGTKKHSLIKFQTAADQRLFLKRANRANETDKVIRQRDSALSESERKQAGEYFDVTMSAEDTIAYLKTNIAKMESFNRMAANPAISSVSQSVVHPFEVKALANEYGNLGGRFVGAEVKDMISGLEKSPGDMLRGYLSLQGVWKAGKVVFDPRAHPRQFVGNMLAGPLMGISFWNPLNLRFYKQAVMDYVSQNERFRTGVKLGMSQGTTYQHELGMAADHSAVHYKTLTKKLQKATTVGGFTEAVLSNPVSRAIGAFYGSGDALPRYAAWLKRMEGGEKEAAYRSRQATGKMDMSLAQSAAAYVHKRAPNYREVGAAVAAVSHTPGLSPFIRFKAEAMKALVTNAIESPWRIAEYALQFRFLEAFTQTTMGLSDEEMRARRLRDGWWTAMVPGTNGEPISMDVGRIGWGLDALESLGMGGKPERLGEQEPEGWYKIAREMAETFFGSPEMSAVTMLLHQYDPYYGKSMRRLGQRREDATAEGLQNLLFPSWAYGRTAAKNKQFRETGGVYGFGSPPSNGKDKYGEDMRPIDTALDIYGGIMLNGSDHRKDSLVVKMIGMKKMRELMRALYGRKVSNDVNAEEDFRLGMEEFIRTRDDMVYRSDLFDAADRAKNYRLSREEFEDHRVKWSELEPNRERKNKDGFLRNMMKQFDGTLSSELELSDELREMKKDHDAERAEEDDK